MNVQRIQASGEVVWRAVRVATVAVVTGFVTHAFALGLGQPNVASVLGQPLQMTVPLVMDAGTELAQECVRIIPGNQSGDPTPSLNAGRITIDAVGRQLRVESLQPMVEPTLRVVVEVGCNQRIRREFALLLDPPSVVAPGLSSAVAGSGHPVSSLGLGMAQISAVLGQRLTLRVPVVGADAGGLTAACVRLADPVSSEGAPVLRQAEIRVLPHDGGSLIEVATPDPVTEPAVRLALDVGCRDILRREYAILLGLPTLAASNVGTTAAAVGPAPSESEPKPAPKRVPQARKAAPAVPVAPEPSQPRAAPAQPLEPTTKAAQSATPGADRLVLGSPQESAGSVAPGDDPRALDPNVELIKRLDTMSKQIEALQAQLLASRQREQELERRALETREEWTWSMIALAGLLLLGALVMAWRQRRTMPQSGWEPVVSRVPQAIAPRAAAARAGADTFVRESSEISGRATMPARATIQPAPSAAITEPSLSDERNSQITVTELHDTVQVIKELYATVLERNTERNTSGAAGGSDGAKPPRPLELDLRTPTRVPAPPPLAEPVGSEGSDRRVMDERFTELQTEVGLDLDLSSVLAAAPEVVLTDLLARSSAERAASPAQRPAVAAPAEAQAQTAESASRVADSAPPAVSPAVGPTRSEAASHGGLFDENLTTTPTEVLLDIDVGTTTGFSHTTDRAAPRLSTQRPDAERARNDASALEPIDLLLDLSQPQVRSRQRAGRSA